MLEDELKAMTAQKERWEKQMIEGGLNASEMVTYMKLRAEVEVLSIKKISVSSPKPSLPGFDEGEEEPIPFRRGG